MTVVWKNRKRLKYKISRLPAVVRKAVREAMEEAAQEIVDAMKRLCPVESGRLRDSINWCWGDPPKSAKTIMQIAPNADAAGINDNKISIFAGSYEAYWARWVEYGTHGRAPGAYHDEHGHRRNAGARGHRATPAEPFFWPTWRAYKRKISAAITRKVNAAIKDLARSQSGN